MTQIKQHLKLVVLLYFATTLIVSVAKSYDLRSIQQQIASHKGDAQRRFKAWYKLIQQSKKLSERKKLERVNRFFNLFRYTVDNYYHGVPDVWKTPDEFIEDGEGDCEDYAIAKYFTLLALGVPMDKLRITYVKSIPLNQAHMVLAYYPEPHSEPLILDNLQSRILPASKRKDLVPVYSFNTKELWLARPSGSDRYLGVNNLKKWQALLDRMK